MDHRNVPGTRSQLKHTSLLPKSCPVREVVALSGGGTVRARPARLFHCTHQPYHTNRHHVKDRLQPVLLFAELVLHHSPQSIGLAKNFVWVLLWDVMEKAEWNFWWIQYFLLVPWSSAWSSSHSLCYCFLHTFPRSFFGITLHVWVSSTQFGVRDNTESEVRWSGFVPWPLCLLAVWPWESGLTSLSFSFLLCKTRSLHIPILWVLWDKNQDIGAKFPADILVVDTWICQLLLALLLSLLWSLSSAEVKFPQHSTDPSALEKAHTPAPTHPYLPRVLWPRSLSEVLRNA